MENVPSKKLSRAACVSAFTLIELLISIAVIGAIAAILLPAVQSARLAASRTECLNNIRGVTLAMVHAVESSKRFPASGNYGRPSEDLSPGYRAHNWVVSILPWMDRQTLYDRYNFELPVDHPSNRSVAETFISALTCPADFTILGRGDLSFVVNGGMAVSMYVANIHDCPVDTTWSPLDFNGNGITCAAIDADDAVGSIGGLTDRKLFYHCGLFFVESWKWDVTRRSHRFSTILDGLSQTIMLSENVRAGADPSAANENWASPNPFRMSFYSGPVCRSAVCSEGNVDYRLANAGSAAINSGLKRPEGRSPVPNSFHGAGAHFSFCDGHVQFVSQNIDGSVYASLLSPQGDRLASTPLRQLPPADASY